MKRFDTRLKIYLTKKQKNQIRKRAKLLDLSMSGEYLRNLARIDERVNEIGMLNDKLKNKIDQLENIKSKIGGEFICDK